MDAYFRDIADGHGAITEAERRAVLADWGVL
jgi:hypothetical protein